MKDALPQGEPAGLVAAVILAIAAAAVSCAGCTEPAKSPHLRIVVFGAKWCGACHREKPIVDGLAKKYHVHRYDADENPAACEAFGVRELPTYVLLYDGREVCRGGNMRDFMQAMVDSLPREAGPAPQRQRKRSRL